MPARLAEHIDEQLARAVDHCRLLGEPGRAGDETDYLDDPGNRGQVSDHRLDRGKRIEGALPGVAARVLSHDRDTNLARGGKLFVDPPELPRDVNVRAPSGRGERPRAR